MLEASIKNRPASVLYYVVEARPLPAGAGYKRLNRCIKTNLYVPEDITLQWQLSVLARAGGVNALR